MTNIQPLSKQHHLFQTRMVCTSNQTQNGEQPDTSNPVVEVIGKASEVPEGTKKIFLVRDRKVLVINDSGIYYAINGICSHYNSPLDKGVYSNGKIRCPLHGACFNVKTGDIEDYPGFDSLHAFDLKESNGDLVISTTEHQLSSDRRTRKGKITKCNDYPIVVVGSGPAAQTFIENSRTNGCSTPIVMVSEEVIPPYDRVKLSKNPSVKGDDIRMRPDEYYSENRVDLRLKTKVVAVDTTRRVVTMSNEETLKYSKLVIATGGTVRKLDVPGSDLENIFYLRAIQQANEIAEKAAGKNVVCIGGSFIGMEIASALSKTAASITVVCNTEEPLPAFGKEVGAAIRKRFEAKGVKILCSSQVVEILGDQKVEAVRLCDGSGLPAEVVVAGIGVLPATDFVKSSPIKLDDRGFITVDKHFRTSEDYVYAIGDVVSAPLTRWDIESINIQHFQVAQSHGQMLGYSIVGKPQPHPVVPFFWGIFFFEIGVRFSGCPQGSDDTLLRGDLDGFNFSQYYFKNKKVVAVASAGAKPVAITFLTLFSRGVNVTKDDVEKNVDDEWSTWL